MAAAHEHLSPIREEADMHILVSGLGLRQDSSGLVRCNTLPLTTNPAWDELDHPLRPNTPPPDPSDPASGSIDRSFPRNLSVCSAVRTDASEAERCLIAKDALCRRRVADRDASLARRKERTAASVPAAAPAPPHTRAQHLRCQTCSGSGTRGVMPFRWRCAMCGGAGKVSLGARIKCRPPPRDPNGPKEARRWGTVVACPGEAEFYLVFNFEGYRTCAMSRQWWLEHAGPDYDPFDEQAAERAKALIALMNKVGAVKGSKTPPGRVSKTVFLRAMRRADIREALLWTWGDDAPSASPICESRLMFAKNHSGAMEREDSRSSQQTGARSPHSESHEPFDALQLWHMLAGERGECFGVESLRKYLDVARLFHIIDVGHGETSGRIDAWELEKALQRDPEVRRLLQIGPNHAKILFQQIDTNESGNISIAEFWDYLRTRPLGDPIERTTSADALGERLLKGIARRGFMTSALFTERLADDPELELDLCIPSRDAPKWFCKLDTKHDGKVRRDKMMRFVRARWVFLRIDKTDSGYIDAFALGQALLMPQVQRELGCRAEMAMQLWRQMDKKGCNHVDFWAFLPLVPDEPPDDDVFTARVYTPPANPQDCYKEIAVVGRGGFGVAVRAQRVHPPDGCPVVLKKLRESAPLDIVQANRREADLLQRLQHPHLVRFAHTYEEVPNTPTGFVVVLEYCSGGDLWAHIKRRRAAAPEEWPGEAKRLFTQVLDGLVYLHRREMVHRDVKPGNVLLTSPGGNAEAKLADFGLLCERVFGERSLTVCGTPGYMAPETQSWRVPGLLADDDDGNTGGQSEDDEPKSPSGSPLAATYGAPNDVWAAGCIAYEMATGDAPFGHKAKTAARAVKQVAEVGGLPASVRQSAGWATGVLPRALEADPDQRWSAEDVLEWCMQEGWAS